ncbi:MAG: hypothetical protein EOP49_31565 [Sphingobacteriales bacterium]|nr:MAG: hypothetical protein EOP49_31565 [Sphingobacteriales bacterium]
MLSILLELAHQNGLEIAFIDWLENANHFCNSLVDRIVPGKFSPAGNALVQAQLGYEDELMIMCEEYALWAIQTNSEKVKSVLSFAGADNTTVLAPDISKFREIKLRLLNGSHTFSAALASLAGFTTVKEAMADASFNNFIRRLMQEAIIPAIESETITASEAKSFAAAVIDRYSNPYVDHLWANICTQSASKMVTRNLQLLTNYADRFGEPSPFMSLGLAAQILYMNTSLEADGKYYGTLNGKKYLVTDQHAALYRQAWQQADASKAVNIILQAEELWGTNLSKFPGLTASVTSWIQLLQQEGAAAAMQAALGEKLLSTNEE